MLSPAELEQMLRDSRRSRARRDDAALRERGILVDARHLPGKHDQSSHGRKGPRGLAKEGAKKAAKAIVEAVTDAAKPGSKPSTPTKAAKAAAKASKATRLKGRDALDAAPADFRFGSKRGIPLTPSQKKALNEYGNDAQRINDQIRRDKMSSRVKTTVNQIDNVMDQSPLRSDVEVWRGVGTGRSVFGDAIDGDLTGHGWTEKAFVSTTADRRVAEEFAGMLETDEPVLLMRVVAPEGTGAIAMSDMGAQRGDQGELVLDRDLPFEVVADHGVVEHPQIPAGVRLIDVEVKPPAANVTRSNVLSPAELEQMLLEDRQQRARADDLRLLELGVVRKFDPGQARNPHTGEWIDVTPGDGTFHDLLKLAGYIDLNPDETLLGSDKVGGHDGNVLLALVERDGQKSLRIGLGDDLFGSRHDEAGPWRAAPGAHTNPSGYTANLDEPAAARLHTALSGGLNDAAELDRLERERDKLRRMGRTWTTEEEARWDSLTAQIEAIGDVDGTFGRTFAEGSVPGQWADVHYSVYVDDPDIGLRVALGAVPHGLDLNDLADAEQAATLTPAEATKLLRLLGKYVDVTGP